MGIRPGGGAAASGEQRPGGGAAGGGGAAVEATAFVAAAFRAAEAARNAPRVQDRFAAFFQPEEGPAAAAVRRLTAAGGDEVVLRTAILDELLTRAVAGRGKPLVLNLGAGFCARPYRLDLSGCALLVEFDAPEVLAYKEKVIKEKVLRRAEPTCPVRRVPLDVRAAPALRHALDELDAADRPSIVVSEGLLPYLPADRVDYRVLPVARRAPGSGSARDAVDGVAVLMR